jgi:D-glycero-D-manno-heptose 1,7-bisphosphate phosphatase
MRPRIASAHKGSEKVVILDRDGTIVVDRNYLSDPAGLEFEVGAAEGLRSMYESGCRLVVITNQSGVGRGLFSLERLQEIHDRLRQMVESIGVRLDGIYYCPHVPDAGCLCRKPQISLFNRAASELGFDASSAVVIGDKMSDIEFGHRAGAATVLVAANPPSLAQGPKPDFVVRDLIQAAKVIVPGYLLKE